MYAASRSDMRCGVRGVSRREEDLLRGCYGSIRAFSDKSLTAYLSRLARRPDVLKSAANGDDDTLMGVAIRVGNVKAISILAEFTKVHDAASCVLSALREDEPPLRLVQHAFALLGIRWSPVFLRAAGRIANVADVAKLYALVKEDDPAAFSEDSDTVRRTICRHLCGEYSDGLHSAMTIAIPLLKTGLADIADAIITNATTLATDENAIALSSQLRLVHATDPTSARGDVDCFPAYGTFTIVALEYGYLALPARSWLGLRLVIGPLTEVELRLCYTSILAVCLEDAEARLEELTFALPATATTPRAVIELAEAEEFKRVLDGQIPAIAEKTMTTMEACRGSPHWIAYMCAGRLGECRRAAQEAQRKIDRLREKIRAEIVQQQRHVDALRKEFRKRNDH